MAKVKETDWNSDSKYKLVVNGLTLWFDYVTKDDSERIGMDANYTFYKGESVVGRINAKHIDFETKTELDKLDIRTREPKI